MIHKVEYIRSIGKYYNYQSSGDLSFKKLTLFYADNGIGKTTLTAIFRSLTENNPDIIRKRISINSTKQQSAQIVERNTNGNDTYHTFRFTGWSAPLSDIEIFDIHFVYDNIYSGFDFNDEHKKQLHEFVIGSQGILLRQQIEQNKTEKTNSRKIIEEIENKIIQTVGNDLSADLMPAFFNMSTSEVENIDKRILDARSALSNSKSNAFIRNLPVLSLTNSFNLDINYATIIDDLNSSVQTIQDQALAEVFNLHCEDLNHHQLASPETWLNNGYEYLLNKYALWDKSMPSVLSCPFCQQPIHITLDVFKAYTQKFNKEFNTFIKGIETHHNSLIKLKLDAIIQSANNTIEVNKTRISSWSTHLPASTQYPSIDILPNIETLKSMFQKMISSVDEKLANPSKKVDTSSFTDFASLIQHVNGNILSYNQCVSSYNDSIKSLLSSIKTEDQAQKELNALVRIKTRFETNVKTLCASIDNEKRHLKELESAYKPLVASEEETANTYFSQYNQKINHYLNDIFHTPFKIEQVTHIPPKGKATQSKIGYKLTIEGQDISFDATQPNSVKDCLSEGDKSAIALAFFLAKIEIDPIKHNKIIVFDDPLSSFDSNRQLATADMIKNLLPQVEQIIVLSHNQYFLHKVSKGVGKSDQKVLRISENYDEKASIIVPLDLESFVEIDYYKHIKELEGFLENADIAKKDIVLGYMRNILEANIKFKFHRQLSEISESNRTFGRIIKELANQNIIFRNDTDPPTIIQALEKINSISCKPHHGEGIPDYESIGASPDEITIKELASYVRLTLDLIDNRI